MKPAYHFSFESDWRTAPLAFWVHVPVPDSEAEYRPPAPKNIARLGYLSSVSSAVKLLEEAGIVRPDSNTAWASSDIPQTGVLANGVKYFKHGYGCAVHLKGGSVDFDFGEKGEITGFDIWRLIGFAGELLH